jgi:hypothetical protein
MALSAPVAMNALCLRGLPAWRCSRCFPLDLGAATASKRSTCRKTVLPLPSQRASWPAPGHHPGSPRVSAIRPTGACSWQALAVLKPEGMGIAMPGLRTHAPHAPELTGSFGCSARGVVSVVIQASMGSDSRIARSAVSLVACHTPSARQRPGAGGNVQSRRRLHWSARSRVESLPLETFDALTRFAFMWMKLHGRTLVLKGEARFLAEQKDRGRPCREHQRQAKRHQSGRNRHGSPSPWPCSGVSVGHISPVPAGTGLPAVAAGAPWRLRLRRKDVARWTTKPTGPTCHLK